MREGQEEARGIRTQELCLVMLNIALPSLNALALPYMFASSYNVRLNLLFRVLLHEGRASCKVNIKITTKRKRNDTSNWFYKQSDDHEEVDLKRELFSHVMPVIFTRNMISPNTTAHPVPEPPPQPRGGGMEM